MRFDSRVVCEFECNTSKDNHLFATLSLSSTVNHNGYLRSSIEINFVTVKT